MTKKKRKFFEIAKRQFRRSCIPTTTAVLVSVMISKLGIIPALPFILISSTVYAWVKGYKIRLVKPEDETNENEKEEIDV